MQAAPCTERFHTNLKGLAEASVSILSKIKEPGVLPFPPQILMIGFSLVSQNKDNLINGFIRKSHGVWDKILRKDVGFFVENSSSLFGDEVPKEKIQGLTGLFQKSDSNGKRYVCEEDIDLLFKYLFSLVKISIKHVHEKRRPFTMTEGDKIEHGYREKFMEEIDLVAMTKAWGMTLMW